MNEHEKEALWLWMGAVTAELVANPSMPTQTARKVMSLFERFERIIGKGNTAESEKGAEGNPDLR